MKTAIIGCGGIAEVHAECVRQLAGNELVGFADSKAERAERFAAKYGGRAFDSLGALLDTLAGEREKSPDVLHLCTPHALHVPMAVEGLRRGFHVFCEKPPVISEAQWKELEKAVCAAAPPRLGFCFQNRYNPSFLAAQKLLASGACGRVLGGRGIVTWNRQKPYYTESGWRGTLTGEGGGVLINQAIHTLDLLTVLLGRPVWTEARAANHHLPGVIEVEDTMEALVRYESGASVCFYATTAYCDDRPPLIEIACERATIRIEELETTVFWRDGRIERPALESREKLGKSYWGSGHKDCIADFYRCCKGGERFAQDLAGVRDTTALMLAMYRSAREEMTVEL